LTVSSEVSRWSLNGNGTTGPFAYTTKIFVKTDLKVYVDGTLKTVDTHYTVSGVLSDSGGNVTFTVGNEPPAGTNNVVIEKSIPYTQDTSLPLGGPLPSTSITAMVDRATMQIQQVNKKVTRSLRQMAADADDIGELPLKASRAGKLLRFNATTGDPEAVVPADIDISAVSAFAETLLDDASASAARTTLELGALATLATAGTAQIDNDAVTYAKMQNVSAASRLLGRGSAAGSGDAEEITPGTGLSMSGATLNVSVTSGWDFVEAQSASTSSTIDLGVANLAAGYDYLIKCINVKNSADQTSGFPALRFGTGAGPTYQTTNHTTQLVTFKDTDVKAERDLITSGHSLGPNGAATIDYVGGGSAGETWDAIIEVSHPAANAIHRVFSQTSYHSSTGNNQLTQSAGWRTTAEVLTALRLLPSSGTFESGTFVLMRRKIAA